MSDQVTPTPEPLETTVAGKRTIGQGTPAGRYEGDELRSFAARPGAMDAFDLPSLMGGQRVYRNNTKEQS